jgi:hypothetical protein
MQIYEAETRTRRFKKLFVLWGFCSLKVGGVVEHYRALLEIRRLEKEVCLMWVPT